MLVQQVLWGIIKWTWTTHPIQNRILLDRAFVRSGNLTAWFPPCLLWDGHDRVVVVLFVLVPVAQRWLAVAPRFLPVRGSILKTLATRLWLEGPHVAPIANIRKVYVQKKLDSPPHLWSGCLGLETLQWHALGLKRFWWRGWWRWCCKSHVQSLLEWWALLIIS